MNLDRMENLTYDKQRFPRYHATLFRSQTLWDPYTHVTLRPAALVPQRQQQHNWKEKEGTEKDRKNGHAELIGSSTEPGKVSNSSLSVLAVAPQSAASAPSGISANQTREYTAARRSLSVPEPPITIIILLIYRSLGAALPPKYHADRRGVR